MINHLDVSRGEADEILSPRKTAPPAEFRPSAKGQHESWELAVGVLTDQGLYKKSLTIELICQQTLKPHRINFKFSLFRIEYGVSNASTNWIPQAHLFATRVDTIGHTNTSGKIVLSLPLLSLSILKILLHTFAKQLMSSSRRLLHLHSISN